MEAFRQFLKGWLGKLLLVIFLSPLALLGIDTYFTSQANPNTVASVDDVNIPARELNRTLSQERNRLEQELGSSASLIDENKLKTQVLDGLIDRTVLQLQAQKLGLNLSDAQISAMVQRDPSFQGADGKFSQSRFETLLRSNGLDKRALFQDIRTQSALSQLARSVSQTAVSPKAQFDKLVALQNQQRNVQVHRVSAADYTDKVSISDKEIADYYEKNKSTLNTKKTIDLAYVLLSSDKFANVTISPEEMNQAYQIRVAELSKDEQRRASHILFTGDDAAKQAAEVLARLQKGEDFIALAKQYSQDTESKEKGGDLGFAGKDTYDPAFEKALFELKKGELSAVVTSQYGAHIIRLDDIKTAPVPSLDEMKTELTQALQVRKQEDEYQDAIKRINDDALNGKSVKDIAQDEGLSAELVKDYTESVINPAMLMGNAALVHPDVMKKAFDEFALTDQTTSVGINVAPNQTLWIQSQNYRPVRTETLAEATPHIKSILTNKSAMAMAKVDADKIVSQINAMKNVTAASKSLGVSFDDVGAISRQSPALIPSEMTTAFSVSVNGENVVAASDETDDGFTVLAVSAAAKVEQPPLTPEQTRQFQQMYTEVQGQQQFMDYLQYAKSQFDIATNEKALEKLDESS